VDVIQDVGAYAGFAAVVGLAVLAALYFSQARDLRRLREWAGRAPERAAEQAAAQVATPEQAAQEASRPAATGAVRPIPAAKPAGGAKPATAEKPAAAATPGTPATAGKPVPAGGDKPAAAPGAAPPVPATAAAAAAAKPATAAGPAPARPAGAPAKDGPAKETPAAPAKGPDGAPPGPAPATPTARPSTPPPVLPARPAPPVRSPAATAGPQSTAVLPASSARLRDRARAGSGGREGLSARYIALIAAGVIVVGGAAVFGISQLGGDEGGGTSAERDAQETQAPVNPSTVTVSVLNGTTVPGLAAQIGDEVESSGFQRGNVANALDQQRTTSTVLYEEGADREAKLVAKKLGIATVEPIDPDSAALGGNSSVVVIVGADQTQ
jgi:LytR cell envelope-related transcriptional attenuator